MKSKKASALIASIMILGISLTVALSVAVVSIRERKASIESGKSNLAYQTADQGIEAVMYDILKSGKSTTNELTGCSASTGLIKIGNYAVELIDKNEETIDCDSSVSLNLVKKLKSTGISTSSIQRAERAVEVPVKTLCNDETVKSTDEFTKLLLHFDGGSDGESFVDSSENDHAVGDFGDAAISSEEKKFCKSVKFDGSGDYLSISDSDDWDFGEEDFTIDFWVKRSGEMDSRQIIFGQVDSAGTSSGASMEGEFESNGDVIFRTFVGGNTYSVTGSKGITDSDNWHHIAVLRDGDSLKMYLNGEEVGSSGDIGESLINNSSASMSVGRAGDFSGYYFEGFVDEFRVTKGLARWTDDFTPPAFPY